MTTTLNINSLSDIKNDYITEIIKNMFSNFGEIQIVIKPKTKKINSELQKRIQNIENGEELLTFTVDEFEELNKQLLSGNKPDKSKILKTKKYETNYFISK